MPVASLLHAGVPPYLPAFPHGLESSPAISIPMLVPYVCQWTIAGELAKLCGKAGRYRGTLACSTEPTGFDGAPASGVEYSGISHYLCQCTKYANGPHMPSLSIPYCMPVHHPSHLTLCCMLVSHHTCWLFHTALQAHLLSHYPCQCPRYASGPYMTSLTIPYHMPVHHPSQLALCCMMVSHNTCQLSHTVQQAHLLFHYPCQSTRYASRPYMPSLHISYCVLVHHPSQLAPFCMLVTHHTYQAPPHSSATNAGHPTGHPTAILLAP